jgi:hypothetical protein
VKAAERREGIDLGDSHRMLEFACADAEVYIDLLPTFATMHAKLRPAKKMVGDYAIVDDSGDGMTNAFHGSIGVQSVQGLGLGPTKGTLHITRFDQGELAATFEADISKLGEPATTAHIEGNIEYHCAGYDRCGRGGPR